MSTKDLITNKLREAFAPESLDVTDESHLHEGHAGHRPGGETHFRVYIVSEAFRGNGRIDRHRMINAALARGIHDGADALRLAHASVSGASPNTRYCGDFGFSLSSRLTYWIELLPISERGRIMTR